MRTTYIVALGSNQRHHRFGAPETILAAAFSALDEKPLYLVAQARIHRSQAVGPSLRCYANSAALIETKLSPAKLLRHLKGIEGAFGRRARGQKWGARVLDLDIILWSGGIFARDDLLIPHPLFRRRRFVLQPVADIAADWRDPLTGFRMRHLKARLDRNNIDP